MLEIHRILVATDFSSYGDFSIKRAVSLAETFKSRITALHVITENLQEMPLFFLDDEKMAELKQHQLHQAKSRLNDVIKAIPNPKGIVIDPKIRLGIPYRQIIMEAEEGDYDLVVIGARGISRVKEFFYGSNAEKVVRRSPCSVYLVKKDLS